MQDPITAQFSITNNTCPVGPATLAPTVSCVITVQFIPDAVQAFSDSLVITSDDPDPGEATVTVALSGTGAPAPVPDITVTDSVPAPDDLAVGFGTVNVTATSTATVTVANDGTGALTINSVQLVTGVQFSITANNCPISPNTLASSGSCAITVEFAPDSAQDFNDSLNITSDSPNESPVTVALAGTGVVPLVPNIVVTDSVTPDNDRMVSFGSVTQGQSGTESVILENDGTADLALGQITTVGAPFSITANTCTNTLTPAGSCTITVRFQPAAVGPVNGSLNIPSDDPDDANPITVALSGTGVAQPVPDITVTDSVSPADDLLVDFGDVNVGATVDETVTVTNDGTEDLVLGNVVAPAAPFSIAADTCYRPDAGTGRYLHDHRGIRPRCGSGLQQQFRHPVRRPR